MQDKLYLGSLSLRAVIGASAFVMALSLSTLIAFCLRSLVYAAHIADSLNARSLMATIKLKMFSLSEKSGEIARDFLYDDVKAETSEARETRLPCREGDEDTNIRASFLFIKRTGDELLIFPDMPN